MHQVIYSVFGSERHFAEASRSAQSVKQHNPDTTDQAGDQPHPYSETIREGKSFPCRRRHARSPDGVRLPLFQQAGRGQQGSAQIRQDWNR